MTAQWSFAQTERLAISKLFKNIVSIVAPKTRAQVDGI